MLHSELPPCYLFPPSSPDSSVDDLTQVTVLLNGPTGTPYAQGLWRLALKIPESYPKAPPKATFRTRMWHPNVDESTGSVCVDTLKKDWQPRLTLRDVLIVRSQSLFARWLFTFNADVHQPDDILSPNFSKSRFCSQCYCWPSFAGRLRLICSSSQTHDFNSCENTL